MQLDVELLAAADDGELLDKCLDCLDELFARWFHAHTLNRDSPPRTHGRDPQAQKTGVA